jgi:predicted 2-oxoglutarate/Fe(II)-dependent dioxygenase YbiX
MLGHEVVVPGYGRPYLDGDSLDHGSPLVLTVPSVLTADECAQLVARIDALGPTDAPITTSRGFVMNPDIRNNKRVMIDDAQLARDLFARIRDAIPAQLFGRRAVGANERFRCYRYEAGQQFAPHFDGAFQRNEHERSELTFMVYLNDAFTGGTTRFHDFEVDVVPRTGSALLFQHRLLHEGCEVRSGVKYVLRSDVMYASPIA